VDGNMSSIEKQLMFTFISLSGVVISIYDDNTYDGSGLPNSQWMVQGSELFYRHQYHHDWRIISSITNDSFDLHFRKQFIEKYATYLIEKELR
jgi:hypothetical protein